MPFSKSSAAIRSARCAETMRGTRNTWRSVAVRPERVVLIGLPGAGKSTVGPLLARRLGWRFLDLDPLIEAEAGLPIAQIFEQKGEAEFRRLETELTGRLASEPDLVLAPGGGWILRNTMPSAWLVWLQV